MNESLREAFKAGYKDACEMHGAEGFTDYCGRETPLYFAVQQGLKELATILRAKGAEVSQNR